ncbi:uridine diphosphate-N-acetylglucosamine-binding protein YvcK [Acetobacterium paludosum]|uniref:Putative gluconeogenesis factor n=1 Tax=Acetobacterium paludosum TaxID=52693 RepID=A0A923KRJ5_9FIRM|nr:gluconeogenesis factor YvcK family protein [Acetobacterium paludosum]MBC3887332.1 uridine diphosphate-N-acetylglucosamine-binding protein YvcK [Acetobacterium paludosum]
MDMKEYIREFTLKDIVKVRNPRVVAIGGGTGLSVILRGLKKYTDKLTAIVTVGDDGGGSGMLRENLGILPPGDIRSCILALADDENVMQELFNYRFEGGSMEGQSFGNLFLAAMNGISNDFYDAVRRTSDVLQIKGEVLPVTLSEMVLMASLENGEIIEGESAIPAAVLEQNSGVVQLFLKNQETRPLPETIEAIRNADLIIIGPGSLYTSIIPNLLIKDVARTIFDSRAKRFYIGNIMTQPGETSGYTQEDHIRAIEAHMDQNEGHLFDYVVANKGTLPRSIEEKYNKYDANVVQIGNPINGYEYILDDYVTMENGYVRHDADLLAKRIFETYLR